MKRENNVPILKVESINKSFRIGDGSLHVLKNISFDVRPGTFNIIFGPSGSGKTTLLNVILGLEPPETGKVHFHDVDIYAMGQDELSQFRAHRFGIVYQQAYWVPSLNVLENIALPLLFLGFGESESYKRAGENLTLVGMNEFKDRSPTDLSGGQQQRAGLARALISNPWVIMADEPTGNLDSKSGVEVMNVLQSLQKDLKRTILLITHNLEYLAMADNMIYIKDGQLSTKEETLPKPVKLEVK